MGDFMIDISKFKFYIPLSDLYDYLLAEGVNSVFLTIKVMNNGSLCLQFNSYDDNDEGFAEHCCFYDLSNLLDK